MPSSITFKQLCVVCVLWNACVLNQFRPKSSVNILPLFECCRFNSVTPDGEKKSLSSCICISIDLSSTFKPMSYVLVSGLTGFMSPFRLSQGWEDCGGSCTPFGSTSGVYMLECTSSSGPPVCLAKLQRMSMNQEERWTHRQRRGRKRRCPDSHPWISIQIRGHSGSPTFIFMLFCLLGQTVLAEIFMLYI